MTDAAGNGNGNGVSGLPSWARVVGLVGIPGAIACFLVYALTTFATVGVTKLHEEMAAHAETMKQHDAAAHRIYASVDRLLLRVCIQTARTDADRGRCVSER